MLDGYVHPRPPSCPEGLYEQVIKVSLAFNPKERPNFAKITERLVSYLDSPEWKGVAGEKSIARSEREQSIRGSLTPIALLLVYAFVSVSRLFQWHPIPNQHRKNMLAQTHNTRLDLFHSYATHAFATSLQTLHSEHAKRAIEKIKETQKHTSPDRARERYSAIAILAPPCPKFAAQTHRKMYE